MFDAKGESEEAWRRGRGYRLIFRKVYFHRFLPIKKNYDCYIKGTIQAKALNFASLQTAVWD
jgi:hypothetical protein